MKFLKEHIQSFSILTENEVDIMLTSFYPIELKINDYFSQIGQLCNKITFIKSGLVRLYHLNENGEEKTTFFSKTNTFAKHYVPYCQIIQKNIYKLKNENRISNKRF